MSFFNGKENDNEVKGEGNQQDYGMRIYDPRLGRFLSVDPLTNEYPELTPYQFASNSPISGVDLDGLEWSIKVNSPDPNSGGKTEVVYTIKISLAGSSNTLHLNNENDKKILQEIKSTAETVLSNPNAAGTESDPIVKVNIDFTEDDGPFKLNLRPFESISDKNSKTGVLTASGDPLANGKTAKIGETQSNDIDIATSVRFVIKTDGKVSIPTKPIAIDPKEFGRTLAHELGHSAGLLHTFDENNTISELQDKEENLQRVQNNLMNSTGGGTDRPKEYKTNTGTELIPKQREVIKKTITDQTSQDKKTKSGG